MEPELEIVSQTGLSSEQVGEIETYLREQVTFNIVASFGIQYAVLIVVPFIHSTGDRELRNGDDIYFS